METERMPWLFAILTAAWFGWMAGRAGRTKTLWAVGGAAFGLVISTLVIGLGHAVTIRFSDPARSAANIKYIVIATVLIAIVGWLLTSSLHRHHLSIWRSLKPRGGTPEAVASSSKPVINPAKQSPGKAQS